MKREILSILHEAASNKSVTHIAFKFEGSRLISFGLFDSAPEGDWTQIYTAEDMDVILCEISLLL